MRCLTTAILVAVLGGAVSSPAAAEPWGPQSVRRVLDDASRLAERPRPGGGEAAAGTARWIASELEALGCQPTREAVRPQDLEEIRVGTWVVRRPVTKAGGDDNVWCMVPGLGPPTVLLAHYDTVWGSPGAVDNAASVAILLELARRLQDRLPNRPVIIAFPAHEEEGLLGSRDLARRFASAAGVVVALDLVGAEGTLTLNGMSNALSRPWLRWLRARAEEAGVTIDVPVFHRVISRLLPQLERSDHKPFTDAGAVAFHLYHRGDDPIYLPYHSSRDTADELASSSIAEAGAFLESIVRAELLPRRSGDPGLWWFGGLWIVPALVATAMVLLAAAVSLVLVLLSRNRLGGVASLSTWIAVTILGVGIAVVLTMAAGARIGHPSPWVHRPGVSILAIVAVLAGTLAIAGALWPQRWRRDAGGGAVLGACLYLGVAGLAVASGARELATLPALGAVALAGAAATSFRVALPLWCVALLAPLPVMSPRFYRELVFHGFYPADTVPLPVVVGLVTWPLALGASAWLIPALRGRISRIVAALVGVGLIAAAANGLLLQSPPCTGEEFRAAGLACELEQE